MTGYVGPPGLDAARVVDHLGMRPLAEEGGVWSQVLRNDRSSAIYYLLAHDDFSAFHRLAGPETYHFYAGWPLRLILLHPDGTMSRQWVSPWLDAGHRPAFTVDGGIWQASRTGGRQPGSWTLVGTTMAPPFQTVQFELGSRDVLIDRYPAAADEVRAHTRESPPSSSP